MLPFSRLKGLSAARKHGSGFIIKQGTSVDLQLSKKFYDQHVSFEKEIAVGERPTSTSDTRSGRESNTNEFVANRFLA